MEIICIYFSVLAILLFTAGLGVKCKQERDGYVCMAFIWPIVLPVDDMRIAGLDPYLFTDRLLSSAGQRGIVSAYSKE